MNIQATLASSDQLPTPTMELKNIGAAYLIPHTTGSETHKHIWVIQGTTEANLQWTDLGISGEQGPQGAPGQDGQGWNTLTDVNLTLGNTTVQYDTTNGIQINSTARFTDAEGNHDATMELALPVVGKDGIVIDKAADSEKIEISGKKLIKDPYPGVNKTGASIVNYKPNDSADWGMQFIRCTHSLVNNAGYGEIVGYDNGGVIYAKTVSDDPWSVVNKEYADNNFRKALKTEVGQWKVYASRNGDPNAFFWTGTEVLSDQAVVVRGNNGSIYTNMPNAANMKDTTVPNKKYVDDAIASISSTTQTKYQHNLVLEGTQLGSTFKAFMSIPRSDDTPFGTLDEVISALGNSYISCTGYIYDGNQKSYAIVSFNPAGPGFEYNDPETGGQVFVVSNDIVTVTDDPIPF